MKSARAEHLLLFFSSSLLCVDRFSFFFSLFVFVLFFGGKILYSLSLSLSLFSRAGGANANKKKRFEPDGWVLMLRRGVDVVRCRVLSYTFNLN